MRVNIEIEGMEEIERDWRGGFLPRLRAGMTRCVRRAVDDAARLAKQLAPVSANPKGTHLRDRITAGVSGAQADDGGIFAVSGYFAANAHYASFVENGTRPHIIRPRNVEVLAWEGGGGQGDTHFAREVHHPGTRAHPFMGPAFQKAESRLEAELRALVETETARFESED